MAGANEQEEAEADAYEYLILRISIKNFINFI
jgi:hypothetical protein